MKIVLAPDSYKGCLSASEVADSMETAILRKHPGAKVVKLPVSDGGEGLLDAVASRIGASIVHARVSDPLGRTIDAAYAVLGDMAIIETAAACGLALLSDDERNPLVTSTVGVGEMILDAISRGCRKFLVGLGGSATNDGGKGMTQVPGLREAAEGMEFTLACDVDAPFIGPNGASRVFAPQKGASEEDVELLERRMEQRAAEIMEQTGTDVRNIPGAGAVGGLGGAFIAYFNARMKPGIELVLDTLDFDSALEGTDMVITGEGRSDRQTLMGKAAYGILKRASGKGVPVALVSGSVADREELEKTGFRPIISVSPEGMALREAMEPETAKANIRRTILERLVISSR